MDPRLRGCGSVTYLHLGDQCPYSGWFAQQACGLAKELGVGFTAVDVTGKPELTAPLGAYLSMQVRVPGFPLLGAPRATSTMLSLLETDLPQHGAQAEVPVSTSSPTRPPAPPPGCLCTVRPGDRDWVDAVSGSTRVCLSASFDSQQRQSVALAKGRWLQDLANKYGTPPFLTTVRLGGQVVGFAELIPAGAGHVPIPAAAPTDMFLTCVHAAPDTGDLRPALIRAAQASAAAMSPGRPAIWAVTGRLRPYPNGPLSLFTSAGFELVAALGRRYHALSGWDDLLLVRWAAQDAAAQTVGLLLTSDDNVVTLPFGCEVGGTVKVRGAVLGFEMAVEACDTIAGGHKMAVRDIGEGLAVIKYGQPIGLATRPIMAGEHVHVHNLVSDRAGGGHSGHE